MVNKDSDAPSMTYWVWLAINSKGGEENRPVLGYDLWTYAGPRVSKGLDLTDYTSAEYRAFKMALSELERVKAIESTGKSRTRARLMWTRTETGDQWWQDVGLALHDPDSREEVKELPFKKWLGREALTGLTWVQFQKDFRAGKYEIALRPTSS